MNYSGQRFYEKYWKNPHNAAPVKDPLTEKRLNLLFNTLQKIGSVKKILDAGCGTGFFTNAMNQAGYEAVGIDISENAIARARTNYSNIEFFCGPLDGYWPFEDKIFDAIFASEVIEHVFGTYEMFFEMNRVLKRGGVLILTTPYHGLFKNLIIVLSSFNRHFNNIEGGHIRFFTNKFLKSLLMRFGFKVINVKCIGRFWPISKDVYIVARKIDDAEQP